MGLAMVPPEPQTIVEPSTEAAVFLVLTANPGSEDVIRDLIADASGLKRSVGFRVPEATLTLIVGIGAGLWARLFGEPAPAGLHPFTALRGPRHVAPSTPGDLLFHIRARRFDLCFELAQRLTERLAGSAVVIDEVHGFRSFDERDLLGFVDGTENPEGVAAHAAVTIGDEDPDFAGGSYVIVQKYVHDLTAWDALAVEDQERAIGRSKLSDIEMDDAVKPPNSHLALNVIEDENGEQLQILRFNMPFGRVGSRVFGTYFIGYARRPDVIEEMLTNMFIGKPPGTTDRILDFSTALTGNLFYVPSIDFLDDPPDAPAAAEEPAAPSSESEPPVDAEPSPGPDGSLRIGSLRPPS
jgi:putative iron-dependent peroxidase